MHYAGIGSRETPADVLKMMSDIGTLLAIDGHTCCTGAAKGADQAFANGADRVNGQIVLALPWKGYEMIWCAQLKNMEFVVYNENVHHEAASSVRLFHPKGMGLTQGAFKLHARNYLIINGCELVICWTRHGLPSGGTGQGIRIAKHMGIPIHNLGDSVTFQAYADRLLARQAELIAY